MDWELFTYGGGELLRLVLNGVAALTATDDFIGLLRAVALFGLVWVLVEGAFNLRRLNMQWLLLMALIYLTLIVPRANVIITDRVDPRANAVVSNVPLGMAFFIGNASRIGDWLTRSFETAFALPNQLRYGQSGAFFAHHLLQSATRFEITDARLSDNLSEFWRQCVFYDLLLGQYSFDMLRDAADMRVFIGAHTSRARMFPYQDTTGRRDLQYCRDAWNGSLAVDLDAEAAAARRFHGNRLVNASSLNEAVTRFSAALPAAYQFISGLSRNADQLITQHALASSLERGVLDFSVANNAPAAAQAYTLTRAQRERRVTFAALGELAARTLPLLRNVLESMIYGIFPIICVLLILPTAARAGMIYLKAILWVQLWAPLYAILNLAVTLYSRAPGRAALSLPDGSTALTLSNHTALGEALAELSAIAGYLSLSIPLIAYLVLNAAGAVAASLASSLMHSYEAPVGRAAEEATTGNVTLANTHVGNAAWWQQNTAPTAAAGYARWTDLEAQTHTTTASGVHAVQTPQTALPVSMRLEERIQQRAEERYEQSQEQLRVRQQALQQSTASMQQFLENFSTQWQQGKFHELGIEEQRLDRAQAALDRLSSYDSRIEGAATVQHGRTVTAGAAANFGASISRMIGGGLGVSASSTGRAAYASDSRQSEAQAERTALREAYDTLHGLSEREAMQERMGREFRSSVQQAATTTELIEQQQSLQAALRESTSTRQLLSRIEDEGVSGSAELSGRLYWRLAEEQGTTEAGRLFAIYHGNVPQATDAERRHAAMLIERHVEELSTTLEAEFAGASLPVEAVPTSGANISGTNGINADVKIDAQMAQTGSRSHVEAIDQTLEQAEVRLQAARQEQDVRVTEKQQTGQDEVRRAAGILGDQHDIQTSGQKDATGTAIGAAIRHLPRSPTTDTIRSDQ